MKVPTEILEIFNRMTNTTDGRMLADWIRTVRDTDVYRTIYATSEEERAIRSGRSQVWHEILHNLTTARDTLEKRK
jgi:hypothetical protein